MTSGLEGVNRAKSSPFPERVRERSWAQWETWHRGFKPQVSVAGEPRSRAHSMHVLNGESMSPRPGLCCPPHVPGPHKHPANLGLRFQELNTLRTEGTPKKVPLQGQRTPCRAQSPGLRVRSSAGCAAFCSRRGNKRLQGQDAWAQVFHLMRMLGSHMEPGGGSGAKHSAPAGLQADLQHAQLESG